MIKTFLSLSFFLFSICTYSQQKVSFYSTDSLKLTADLYLVELHKPFILLFHQAESSRAEYKTIAPKLMNLGYNCLAVDLRVGDKVNYIANESAQRARKENKPNQFLDAQQDIDAAIEYVKKYNQMPVILFGSSYSASLSLIAAKKSENISAVIAFSPGEYFRPKVDVMNEIEGLEIPVFASSTELEYKYTKELFSKVGSSNKTIHKPTNGRGVHGAKALWEESQGSKECWFQLTYFMGMLDR